MYATHATIISQYARSSPEAFAAVVQFVILTIRQPLYRVPDDTITAARQDEQSLDVLWGWKWQAYNSAETEAEATYSFCEHIYNDHSLDDQETAAILIEYLADLPGLGLAKAGFVIQLIYGLAGCLDTHNITQYGLPPRTFDSYKQRSSKARRKLCQRYVQTVYELGGPEVLWNNWCEYVATHQADNYRDAYHVSALHCEALNL